MGERPVLSALPAHDEAGGYLDSQLLSSESHGPAARRVLESAPSEAL